MSADALWDRLQAVGLVEGERPAPDRVASPWYVRLMLGFAGWLGAMFLILFLGVGFASLMESTMGASILGAILCAIAWFLFSKFDGTDFIEQFALALSLVGQMAIIAGLANVLTPEHAHLYLAIAVLEIGLALLISNFLHRVLATSGAAVALALFIYMQSVHGLSAPFICAGLAFVWLEPKRWAAEGRLWRPIGYGLLLALLLVETFRLFGGTEMFGSGGPPGSWLAVNGPLIGRGLTALLLVGLAVVVCRQEGHGPQSRTTLVAAGAAALFGLFSLWAPGLASAVLVLLLGFAAGNRILIALGILSLFGFVSHFYYSLAATLLEKSGLLAVTGLLLLGACLLLRRSAPAAEAADA